MGNAGGRAGAHSIETAGAVGSGGTASTAAPRPSFLDDGPGYERLATGPQCRTRVAKNPGDLWPKLAFSSCGPGCESASALPLSSRARGSTYQTAARLVGDELRITLRLELPGDPATVVLTTLVYGDGHAAALVVEDGGCEASLSGRASPNLYSVFPAQGDLSLTLGWLTPDSPPTLRWLPGTSSRQLKGFDIGTTWGGIDARTEVFVAKDALSEPSLASVYSSPGLLSIPAAHQGIAAWSEWGTATDSVVAWTEETGPLKLASGSWSAGAIGISEQRIVWLAGTGPRTHEGEYEAVKVVWCDRTKPLSACTPTDGPTLPITSAATTLAVADRFIVASGCEGNDCNLYVVDMGSNKVNRIKPAAGHQVELIGLSKTSLFAADAQPGTESVSFDSIRRYDLNRLAEFSTEL